MRIKKETQAFSSNYNQPAFDLSNLRLVMTGTDGTRSASNIITTVPLVDGKPIESTRNSSAILRPSSFHLASRLFEKVLCVHRASFDIILAEFSSAVSALPALSQPRSDRDDDDNDGDDPFSPAPYQISNGVAMLKLHGPLFKRSNFLTRIFGLTTYQDLTTQLLHCMGNPNVSGILLDVDSPGGEANGMGEISDLLYSLRSSKPIYSCSNDAMYSAAYGIGSAASRVYVTRDGGCGSIGCYMMHLDRSGMDENFGLKYTYIYAGDHKVDGNQHAPLSKDAKATMQDEVNRIRDMFVTQVARNRNVTAQSIIDTQAAVYFAEECLPMLADKIGTLDDAYSDMLNLLGKKDDDDRDIDDDDDDDDDDDNRPFGTYQPRRLFLGTLLTPAYCGAIPYSKTPTIDSAWDGLAAESKLNNDQPSSYYRKEYAWQQSGSDGTKKSYFKFPHHMVSDSGEIGAANLQACRSGIGVINGVSGGGKISAADRRGIYNHLAKHLKSAKIDPPPFKSEGEYIKALEGTNFSIHSTWSERIARQLWQGSDGRAVGEFIEISSEFGGGIEGAVRILSTAPSFETRSDSSKQRTLTLLVAPYDGSLSCDLGGGVKELYASGCFSGGLNRDPRILFMHDEGKVLGRAKSKTARFWEDAKGLWAECQLPDTSYSRDMENLLERGDIDQASAAFYIVKSHMETRGSDRIRVIDQAILREASVYSFAAYETTQAYVQPEPVQSQSNPNNPSLSLAEARLRLFKLQSGGTTK